MAKPTDLAQFLDKLDDVSLASNEAAKEGLEKAINLIPADAWKSDAQVVNTLRNILNGARSKLGEVPFNVLTTWLFTYVASKLSGSSRLGGPLLRLAASGADEALLSFMESGKLPEGGAPDAKATKPTSKITGPIWCDDRVVHHADHHPLSGKAVSGGEQTPELMGRYVRASMHFCTECFTPGQISGFFAAAWSETKVEAPKKDPPSRNFATWTDPTRNLFACLYNEALRESKEGDYDRGVERIAPILLTALHTALTWDSATAEMAFAGADSNWENAIKDRGADVRQLFALPIAKVIALANADKAEIPGGSKSSGLADILDRISAALNIPDEWRGTLDAAIRTLPAREQQIFTALLVERAGSVAASVSRLMTQVAIPAIFAIVGAWTFLPMLAWSQGNAKQVIFLMIVTVIAFYLPGVFGYFLTNEELIEASTEDSVPIAGGPDRRYRPGHVREAAARYSNGANSAAAAASYILSLGYTVFGAPLLGAVTATGYSLLLAMRGDFIWHPLFMFIMMMAVWYIPFLLIDMGVATGSTVINTILSLIPNEGIKARATAALNSNIPHNNWKDVGLKASNGLQVLGLLQVFAYWPIYPFVSIPGATLLLAGYLMVTSWYSSSLLTMARPQNGTDPNLLSFLARMKLRYVGISFMLFQLAIIIALSTPLFVAMNGGAKLQRADTIGENGTNRPESIGTVVVDFGRWMVTPSPAQAQARAAARVHADNCTVLKSALLADPGFCGNPAAETNPLCGKSTNPTCWTEIAQSITVFHSRNEKK